MAEELFTAGTGGKQGLPTTCGGLRETRVSQEVRAEVGAAHRGSRGIGAAQGYRMQSEETDEAGSCHGAGQGRWS